MKLLQVDNLCKKIPTPLTTSITGNHTVLNGIKTVKYATVCSLGYKVIALQYTQKSREQKEWPMKYGELGTFITAIKRTYSVYFLLPTG